MDDFDDADFDNLNATALQELENSAIRFTQAHQPVSTQAVKEEDDGLEDDDLDDAVVMDGSLQLHIQRPVQQRLQPQIRATTAQNTRPPPARNIQQPRWQQPATGQRLPSQYQHARQTAPSSNSHGVARPAIPDRIGPPPHSSNRPVPQPTNSQFMRAPPPLPRPTHQQVQFSQEQPRAISQDQDNIVTGLQAEVANLQAQVADQQAQVKALKNDLQSARGEASIVRSQLDKSNVAHEAEVARLEKRYDETVASYERKIEALTYSGKAFTTELQFQNQDLKDQLSKSKKTSKDPAEITVSTPKKSKTNSFNIAADGFDTVEILPSPSKTQAGAKGKGKNAALAPGERTPTRAKRKRPTIESPATALELEGDVTMADAVSVDEVKATGCTIPPKALPYDLIHLVLMHGSIYGQPLTFELFARYSYPSSPEQFFAGIIFQRLPSLGDPNHPTRMLIDFCELLIDMWDQCLREKYYEPIYDLVALITFILQLDTTSVAPYIASTLVPVAQTTVFLLSIPRFESEDGDLTTSMDETTQRVALNIDTQGTLQLMYLVALGCFDSYLSDPDYPLNLGPAGDSPQRLFWKVMGVKFVFVALSPKQPRDDFLAMLNLLSTSCLPDSIGPITDDPQHNPEYVARTLVEKVSRIMIESLFLRDSGTLVRSFSKDLCIIRVAALETLTAFLQSKVGATQLALCDVLIPRLVKVLSQAINALYDIERPIQLYNPGPFDEEPDEDDETWTEAEMEGSLEEHELKEQGDKQPPEDYEMKELGEDKPLEDHEMKDAEKDQALAERKGMKGATDADGTADHPIALDDEGDTAVDQSPSPIPPLPPLPSHTPEAIPSDMVRTIISSSVFLIYTLATSPETSALVDIRAKLSASYGTTQSFLVSMARLNYTQGNLVFETGIDSITCDRANDLLGLAITREEAQDLRAMFEPDS